MNPECPSCHRPVADRRRAVCLYCGGAIPEEMLFSPEEAAAVDAEMEELAQRRAAFKAREEEERRDAARKNGDGGYYGPSIGPTGT